MAKIRNDKGKDLRCYIYTRVSTEMQIDGYSLDAQEESLRKAAAYHEMQVVHVFSDEGKSGKTTTGRPEFQEMMRRIANGNEDHVDYVLVFKLSRFGRNTADVLNNVQLMEDFGVNLLAVEDKIDSAGSAGKLIDYDIREVETDLTTQMEAEATKKDAHEALMQITEKWDTWTSAEKKRLVQAWIKELHLFPKQQKNGVWIKRIVFQFPAVVLSKVGDAFEFPADANEPDTNFQQQETTDETYA